ncbi:MAG: hypothetical protein LH615_15570 [Ferruginibacter sp.]|nr:hypothetical protein [Ferruginibacter sp.]
MQYAINKLMGNIPSFLLIYRLSTISHADEIIVMRKGEIVERGTLRLT